MRKKMSISIDKCDTQIAEFVEYSNNRWALAIQRVLARIRHDAKFKK